MLELLRVHPLGMAAIGLALLAFAAIEWDRQRRIRDLPADPAEAGDGSGTRADADADADAARRRDGP